jgi:hypothetical protein
VACLSQSLFALNGVYLLNEKGAARAAEKLTRRPADFSARIAQAIAAGAAGLPVLMALVEETGRLCTQSPSPPGAAAC